MRGMTVKMLAERIGVSPATVREVERSGSDGQRWAAMRMPLLGEWARVFDVPATEVLKAAMEKES